MNRNPLTTILQGVLAFSALLSIIFLVHFYFKTREARSLQMQMMGAQQRQTRINQLLAETVEYSRRNPAIDPILVSLGVKQAPVPGKPAAKN